MILDVPKNTLSGRVTRFQLKLLFYLDATICEFMTFTMNYILILLQKAVYENLFTKMDFNYTNFFNSKKNYIANMENEIIQFDIKFSET